MIPSQRDTELLRTVLGSNGSSRATLPASKAIERALSEHPDLVPLLARSCDRPEIAGDLRGRLDAVRRANETHAARFRELCGDVARVLGADSEWFAAMGDAALASETYGDWELRQLREITLLVPGSAIGRNGLAIQQNKTGFRLIRQAWSDDVHELILVHPDDLTLRLSDRSFPGAPPVGRDGSPYRTRAGEWDSTVTRVLEAEESLVRCLVRAGTNEHEDPLQWVCDAWTLIDRARDFDWERFGDRTGERYRDRVAEALGFLGNQLGSPVPDGLRSTARD